MFLLIIIKEIYEIKFHLMFYCFMKNNSKFKTDFCIMNLKKPSDIIYKKTFVVSKFYCISRKI